MVYDDDTGRSVSFEIEPGDEQYNYTGKVKPPEKVQRRIREVAGQHPRWNVQEIVDHLRTRGEYVPAVVVDSVLRQANQRR